MTRLTIRTAILAAAVATAVPAWSTTPAILSDERYQYTILSQDLDAVLREFGASLGVSMTIDDAVSGRVVNFRGVFSPSEFLDRLTQEHGLEWYFDGTTVHVTPVSKNQSIVVDFRKVSPELLDETLASLGLSDDRFKVRATDQSGIGVLSGPPRYIELVENAFTILEQRYITTPAPENAPAVATRGSNILIIRGDSTQVWSGKNAMAAAPTEEQDAQSVTPEPEAQIP